MSYHIADLNRTIQRLREKYGAAGNHLAATAREVASRSARDTAKPDQTETRDRSQGGSLAAE